MTDIRYVCISDLHLGAQNSLLTNLTADGSGSDPSAPGPVLRELVACLRWIIERNEDKSRKPALILAGDIFELALATDDQAAMAFERFVELIMPAVGERLFERLLFIPGNHDHHLWETARETQYVNYIQRNPGQKPGMELKVPWHATNMFVPWPNPNLVASPFVNGIIQRFPHLQDVVVDTIYPNMGLRSADGQRCVVITHGHFIESRYQLMSRLKLFMFPEAKKSASVWDIEGENFAWIDFYWSTLGRSGDAGTHIEIVYDKLQDPRQKVLLVDRIAAGLARNPKRAAWKNWLLERTLRKVLRLALSFLSSSDRSLPETVLGDDASEGFRAWLEGPVLKQIQSELPDVISPQVAVIFGHTHKPFEALMDLKNYPPDVKVYNSGGWAVDTPEPQPLHGGSILLMDEDLQIVSLRMYNETNRIDDSRVKVHAIADSDGTKSRFHERISGLVDASKDPWISFSSAILAALPIRRKNMKQKMEKS